MKNNNNECNCGGHGIDHAFDCPAKLRICQELKKLRRKVWGK